jgi:hypothetical protein
MIIEKMAVIKILFLGWPISCPSYHTSNRPLSCKLHMISPE